MDLTAFYARYEGDGRGKSPYEPRTMLKVLIYGYALPCLVPRPRGGVMLERAGCGARASDSTSDDMPAHHRASVDSTPRGRK